MNYQDGMTGIGWHLYCKLVKFIVPLNVHFWSLHCSLGLLHARYRIPNDCGCCTSFPKPKGQYWCDHDHDCLVIFYVILLIYDKNVSIAMINPFGPIYSGSRHTIRQTDLVGLISLMHDLHGSKSQCRSNYIETWTLAKPQTRWVDLLVVKSKCTCFRVVWELSCSVDSQQKSSENRRRNIYD